MIKLFDVIKRPLNEEMFDVFRQESTSHDGDADVSEVEAEIQRLRQRIKPHKGKAVRFEDILDDSAPGDMGPLRRKLRDEGQRSRAKAQVCGTPL